MALGQLTYYCVSKSHFASFPSLLCLAPFSPDPRHVSLKSEHNKTSSRAGERERDGEGWGEGKGWQRRKPRWRRKMRVTP